MGGLSEIKSNELLAGKVLGIRYNVPTATARGWEEQKLLAVKLYATSLKPLEPEHFPSRLISFFRTRPVWQNLHSHP
jgi:hypothetical protein